MGLRPFLFQALFSGTLFRRTWARTRALYQDASRRPAQILPISVRAPPSARANYPNWPLSTTASLGFIVAKPYGDNERYDFVVDSGQRLWRVQVKSTSYLHSGSYRVLALLHLRRQTVTYQPSEVDFLVAHVIPRRRLVCSAHQGHRRPSHSDFGAIRFGSPSSRLWDAYREAWHLFREDGVTEQGLPCL